MATVPPAVAMDRLREAVRAMRAQSALIPRVALAVDPALPATHPAGDAEAILSLDHGGELRLGRIGGTVAVSWSDARGRSGAERAFPVRLARLLGADTLVLAARARALGPETAAELAVVDDHVGFLVANPLVGPNLDELGPRFPDMTEAYDPDLRALAREEAARAGTALGGGVYAALRDPNLATAAEYTVLEEAGVAWVGQGGVQETIAARHAGMRVLGLVGRAGAEDALASLVVRVIARIA